MLKRFLCTVVILSLWLSHTSMAFHPYDVLWGNLLKKHTQEGKKQRITTQLVNYHALATSQSFKSLKRVIQTIPPNRFKSTEAQLALYINFYNISVIDAIISTNTYVPTQKKSTPRSSVTQTIASFNVTLQNVTYTLTELKSHILTTFSDPRIHFALCSGEISSPPLNSVPYTAKKLNQQLTDQTRTFLTNQAIGTSPYHDTKELFISKLFLWHEPDFKTVGGTHAFLNQYLPIDSQLYKLLYLPYYHQLNSQ